VVLGLLTTLLAPSPARADGTAPSKHQVQQARQRAEDKAAQVAHVRGRLAAADSRLQQSRISAEQAAEKYNQARWELDRARQVTADAQARALGAQQQVQQQHASLVSVITQSYEGGGQLATLDAVFSASGPQQLMSQYLSYEGASSALQAGYERLDALSITAEQFQQQAKQAQAEQSQLVDQAQQALQEAQLAETSAAALSAQVAAERDRLTKQLAKLQGISTALAAERQRALAREAARAAARAERRKAQQASERSSGSASSSGPTSSGPTSPGPTPSADPPPSNGRAAQAVNFAKAQLGNPYVYGAAGPNAWDCSGLIMGAWRAAGVSLPHSASLQYSLSTPITAAELQPGDLVFWSSNPRDPNTIYHVAMYIGDGKMIQAPQPGEDVQIDPLYYWIPPTLYARV
jgi:cell wall-associated NlpC family hydrolase